MLQVEWFFIFSGLGGGGGNFTEVFDGLFGYWNIDGNLVNIGNSIWILNTILNFPALFCTLI
jgi:hypothetical protein